VLRGHETQRRIVWPWKHWLCEQASRVSVNDRSRSLGDVLKVLGCIGRGRADAAERHLKVPAQLTPAGEQQDAREDSARFGLCGEVDFGRAAAGCQ
jgi:hypothetical protein